MEHRQSIVFDLTDSGPIYRVARAGDGRYYLSDEFNHRVLIHGADGKRLGQIDRDALAMTYPCGLDVDDRHLYVADSWGHAIQVFDLEGAHEQTLRRFEGDPTQLLAPTDIRVCNDQRYFLDSDHHRLLVCDAHWVIVKQLRGAGGAQQPGPSLRGDEAVEEGCRFSYPRQLEVIGDVIYVIEPNRLVRIGPTVVVDMELGPREPAVILAAGSEWAVLLRPQAKTLTLHDFQTMSVRELATLDFTPKAWLTEDDQLHLFGEQQLDIYQVSDWSALSPIAPFHAVPASAAAPETAVSLDALHAQLERLADSCCAPELQTQNQTEQPLVWRFPVTNAPSPGNFAPEAHDLIAMLEQAFASLRNRLGRHVANQLQNDATAWPATADALFNMAALVQSRWFANIDQLESALADNADLAVLRHHDAIAFYLKRLLAALYPACTIASQTAPSELIDADQQPGRFFLKHLTSFQELDPHLRNALHRASKLALSKTWREAWNQSETVRNQAVWRAAEQSPFHQAMWRLLAFNRQHFVHAGRIYPAYGFPFVRFHHGLALEVGTSFDDLAKPLESSPLWEDPVVRKDVAIWAGDTPDLREAIRRATEVVDAFEARGIHAVDQRAYHEAVAQAAQSAALLKNTKDAFALLAKIEGDHLHIDTNARILLWQDRYDEALAACGDYRGHLYWAIVFTAALIHLTKGDTEQAVAAFAQPGPHFRPHLAPLYHAVMLTHARRFDDAVTAFDAIAVEEAQTFHYHRGILARMMDDHDRAAHHFAMQEAIFPFWSNTLQQILLVKKQGQDPSERISDLPDHAFLIWDQKRIPKSWSNFDQILNNYIDVEAQPTPWQDATSQRRFRWTLECHLRQVFQHSLQDDDFARAQRAWPRSTE